MSVDTSILTRPIANLYQQIHLIASNLIYIQKELSALSISADLKHDISTMCEEFQSAVYDVKTEIRNLEDKLGMHPGEEAFDPNIINPDPRVTMGFIERWIAAEIQKLDNLVRKLGMLTEQDSEAYGLVDILIRESATNIIQAYSGIKEDLKFITAQLEQ